VGTPSEIYEAPRSRFVADFIGSVNLFDGRAREDARVDCEMAAAELHLAAAPVPGSAVCLAVRPEKIRLSKLDAPFDLPNHLVGRITDMAYLGDTRLYHVRLDSGKVVKVTAPNLGSWRDQPFQREERVRIGWSPEAGVLVEP
jgi:putrescine transport system ATP-binding protein